MFFLAALGAVASIGGAVAGAIGGMNQAAANKKMVAAQAEEEGYRHKQMLLDASRQRREMVRNAIIAQGQALAAGVNQGAGTQSSGVQGGQAGVTNATESMMGELNQNVLIGNKIFEAKKKYFAAGGQYAAAQGLSAIGNGIANLGGFFMQNAGPIAQLGKFAFGG